MFETLARLFTVRLDAFKSRKSLKMLKLSKDTIFDTSRVRKVFKISNKISY